MGCLNSEGKFDHWFGNIHLSGPCNRSCYFCIGQHMMALDPLNVLDTWPLPGIDEFIEQCNEKGVGEINVTGSNTDPLLYKHMWKLRDYLDEKMEWLNFGVRTNGATLHHSYRQGLFDKVSISLTSLDPEIYKKTMGNGRPPNMKKILGLGIDTKVNIVLCPEILPDDLHRTLDLLGAMGYWRVNLREPYGQPHIGNPLEGEEQSREHHGMPTYHYKHLWVTYWDVHYVHVESINLYANGTISTDYPITRGHDPIYGKVQDQSHFKQGRQREQWLMAGKEKA